MTEHVTTVFAACRVEGTHRWPDAPDFAAHLRDEHRHMFHVEVEARVIDLDREVEIQWLKNKTEDLLFALRSEQDPPKSFGTRSCEQIAKSLINRFNARHDGLTLSRVEVSEDGENGARVFVTPDR